jgi:hypothetical protein
MRSWLRLTVLVAVVAAASLAVLVAPAAAGKNMQIGGVAVFDAVPSCPALSGDYSDFDDFTLVMSGNLQGCWYTKIDSSTVTPSNVYQERGREVFVGCLFADDGTELACGTFATTYKFTSKWAGEPFVTPELHGRCEHPIVAGSGTDGFAGATGRVDFKDDVATGEFIYRGHIKLANGA